MADMAVSVDLAITDVKYNILNNTEDTTLSVDGKNTDLKNFIDNFVFYSEAVVQITIFSFGIIFNIINYIILRESKIADTFRVCLLALTLTDIGTCIFAVTQLAVEAKEFRGRIPFGYWHRGALTSHLLYYTFAIFACTSSIYVLLVGGLRAYMISKPHESLGKFKPIHMKITCWLIFLVVFLLFLPSPIYAMFQVCYAVDNTEPICIEFFKRVPYVRYMKYYFYTLSIIFIPSVVIGNIICLVKIKKALHKSNKRALRLHKDEYTGSKHKLSITKTLLVILLLDTLWMMPYCIQYITLAFCPEETVFNINNSIYVVFDSIVEILYSFRPTYNIIIYLCTNYEYKKTFDRKFCSCWVKKGSNEGTQENVCITKRMIPPLNSTSCDENPLSKTTSLSAQILCTDEDNKKC